MFFKYIRGTKESLHECDWYESEAIPIAEDPSGNKTLFRVFKYGTSLAVYTLELDRSLPDQQVYVMNYTGRTVERIFNSPPSE